MQETRTLPNDKQLGEPKRAFNETFSAERVVVERFFKR